MKCRLYKTSDLVGMSRGEGTRQAEVRQDGPVSPGSKYTD